MAARWVGLKRPNKTYPARKTSRGIGHAIHESVHALGAVGFLVMAAAMNFALYPDALAAVVSGRQLAVTSFVPGEPAVAGQTPAAAPLPVNDEEVHLLAATMWGEARSEGEDGMRAVAHVIVNRVGDRFGSTLRSVIRSPKQFSAWNLGDPNRPLVQNPERYATAGENKETWETAQTVAREVLSGQSVDPTHGALFYHTRAITPWWSRYGRGRSVIGAHVFYRDVPDQQRAARRTRPARVITASNEAPQGARAGRVNGVIQYAPAEAPAPTATIEAAAPSPQAVAAIAQLPTSTPY